MHQTEAGNAVHSFNFNVGLIVGILYFRLLPLKLLLLQLFLSLLLLLLLFY